MPMIEHFSERAGKEEGAPFFTVVIPSRDRPELVTEAVASVLSQDFSDFEIVVVDDGSDPALDAGQLALTETAAGKVRFVRLERQVRGHGPGYARNVGVWTSRGRYCAFLDDDDVWTCTRHLTRAHRAIAANDGVDLYLSNQEAFLPHTGEVRHLWLYPLVETVEAMRLSSVAGCYQLSVDELIGAGGFCHLNTSIISREHFEAISGIDEKIGYEEDLDFYLRAIDQAKSILFCPEIVARHNVPDKRLQDNVSTSIARIHQLNTRLYLLNKNTIDARHPSIRTYCLRYATSTLKLIAEHYVEQKDYALAVKFAGRALGMNFTLKWCLYCLYLLLRSWLQFGRKYER